MVQNGLQVLEVLRGQITKIISRASSNVTLLPVRPQEGDSRDTEAWLCLGAGSGSSCPKELVLPALGLGSKIPLACQDALYGLTRAPLPPVTLLISWCIVLSHAELHTGDRRRAGGWCDLQHIAPEGAAPSHGQQRAAVAGGKLGLGQHCSMGCFVMFPCQTR